MLFYWAFFILVRDLLGNHGDFSVKLVEAFVVKHGQNFLLNLLDLFLSGGERLLVGLLVSLEDADWRSYGLGALGVAEKYEFDELGDADGVEFKDL